MATYYCDSPAQEAYEALSASGLVRPAEKSGSLLYSLSVKEFNLPDFTIGRYKFAFWEFVSHSTSFIIFKGFQATQVYFQRFV